MIHPTTLDQLARSAQQEMEREARAAGLARSVSRRRQHDERARRVVKLAFASVVLGGAVLLV